jgi:hypothetical protein
MIALTFYCRKENSDKLSKGTCSDTGCRPLALIDGRSNDPARNRADQLVSAGPGQDPGIFLHTPAMTNDGRPSGREFLLARRDVRTARGSGAHGESVATYGLFMCTRLCRKKLLRCSGEEYYLSSYKVLVGVNIWCALLP